MVPSRLAGLLASALCVVVVAACAETKSSSDEFGALAERSLELPMVEIKGFPIEKGVAGRCFRQFDSGSIALPGIPGEGALGPWLPGVATTSLSSRKSGGDGLSQEERSRLAVEKLKRGPVYAAIRSGPPRVALLSADMRDDGAFLVDAIWISHKRYDGPLLVRGDRVDADGALRFQVGERLTDELELPSGSWSSAGREGIEHPPRGWRATHVPIRIPGPGCYALQMDGSDFSYVLMFGAQE